MTNVQMDVSVCVDQTASADVRFTSKIFAANLKNDIHLLDVNEPEQYIIQCLSNAMQTIQVRNTIGKYTKVNPIDCCVSCTMCMEKYAPNQYKRILPCGHTFHKRCIDKWLFKYNNSTCPYCRTDFAP